MSRIDEILYEKFGFVKNLPENKQPTPARMHDWVTDRNGRGSYTAGGHPMEKYREHVKAMLHALDTEEQSIIENAIDFESLKRLANKHGIKSTFTDAVGRIQEELALKKPDYNKVINEWDSIKKTVPFWFLGMVGKDEPDNPNPRKLPEEDKEALTNLREVMDKIAQVSGKEFRRAAKGTPDDSVKTQAEKNLDKARKSAGIEKLEDIKKKPENEVGKK